MRTRQFMVVLACWAMATVAQAQSRGAVWVHGLAAGADEWAQWADLFTRERQLNTQSRGSFTSQQGVATMAGQVRGSYGANPQSIYFGHSMGGVVGRHIDTDPGTQNTFGAIITAGSAHDGARIANAARNGEVASAIADGAYNLGIGPSAQLGMALFGVPGLVVSSIGVGQAVNHLESVVNQKLGAGFSNQSVTDFMEGSSYQNGSQRNTQTSTAKLLIYGNEESPVHWRLASEQVYNDERMVGWARAVSDYYEAAMWTNYGIAAGLGFLTLGLGAIPYVYIAVQWSRGMNWIRHDSERIWNYLIGSGIPSTFQVCYDWVDQNAVLACMGADIPGYAQNMLDYETCLAQSTVRVCNTYYASTNGQSDGFIKGPSQAGFNVPWANNAIREEAIGVNHLEMRKHPRMAEIYNQAFDGTYGQSFRVSR